MNIFLLRYRECGSLINAYATAQGAIDEVERRFDAVGWTASVQEEIRTARILLACPTFTNGLTAVFGAPFLCALEVVRLVVR